MDAPFVHSAPLLRPAVECDVTTRDPSNTEAPKILQAPTLAPEPIMTRRTVGIMLGAVAVVFIAGCSGGEKVAGPGTTPVAASGSLSPAVVDNDVAVASATVIMADLDNFAVSDAFGGIAASKNVPVVRLGDNPPTTATPTATTPPKSGDDHHGDKPAGTLPTMPATGNPCKSDDTRHELHCSFSDANATSASTVTFVDKKGVKTDGFKVGVTDTVRTTLVSSSKVVSADSSFRGTFYRSSNRAVGGFTDPNGTRTTNGTGIGADTSSFVSAGNSRKYAGVSADTVKALVYAEHRAQNPFPKSGTMIHVVRSSATSVEGQGKTTTTEINRRVVVTYDGSATATVQVGSTTCQLHLDSRKVDSCH